MIETFNIPFQPSFIWKRKKNFSFGMRLTLILKAISLISGIFNASLSLNGTKQERLLELKSENDMLEDSSEQVDLYD